MSLKFIDGCTHYSDPAHKYGLASDDAAVTDNPAYVRRMGAKALWLPTASDYVQTRALSGLANRAVIGAAFRWTNSVNQHGGITLYKGSTPQLTLMRDNFTGALIVKRGGPDGTQLATTDAGVVTANRWYYLEFNGRVDDSVGSTTVYLNGTELEDLTLVDVDTKPGSDTGVDRIRFFGGQTHVCDVWIDGSIGYGDCIVDTIMPTGAGANADWSPSAGDNYENVDDDGTIDEDATYNSSTTVNDVDTFAFEDLPSRPSSEIIAVAVNTAARKDDTATRTVIGIARIGGVDYNLGSSISLESTYQVHQSIADTTPSSDPWEETDVNGAEFGYKHYSVA